MMKREKIKVLQVVDGFRMGGAENKLWELVERLNPERFESYIANVGPSGPLEARFSDLGVPIYQCQRRHRFDVMPILKLKKIMRQHKIHIVQNTLFWADVVGSMAARWAKVPAVVSWETVTHAGNPYHRSWQRRAGYRFSMRFADRVVAVSHEIKDSLIRERGLPEYLIEVIHYGVDLSKFAPNGKLQDKRAELGLNSSGLLVGIVARLEEIKGHTDFVEAFARIAANFTDVTAIFVGDGSQRAALEKQVADRGIKDRVHFLGIRKDVTELLNAMDVFVLPSIGGEGLPNVVLEAMACGKPVVATQVGGTPEAVHDGENGFIVPPRDIDGLQHALEKILLDRGMIKRFSKRSREIAEQEFSLEKQVGNFENLYSKLYLQRPKKV